MKNIFDKEVSDDIIGRINKLQLNKKPLWGKMSASKMLAHCNVQYEMVYTDKHKKPNVFMKSMLKLLVKNTVVSEKPYKRNLKTAPQFLIVDNKNFEEEKVRLKKYIEKTQELGGDYFNGKESHSFGKLTKQEWNNLFYKHLDHHLSQFEV